MKTLSLAFAAILLPASVSAQPGGEVDYPRGALGFDALMSSDLSTAEAQLKASPGAFWNDPAKLINYGQVMARTGRTDEAAALFRHAMSVDDVELVLADGTVMTSRDAAATALKRLRPIQLSSR